MTRKKDRFVKIVIWIVVVTMVLTVLAAIIPSLS